MISNSCIFKNIHKLFLKISEEYFCTKYLEIFMIQVYSNRGGVISTKTKGGDTGKFFGFVEPAGLECIYVRVGWAHFNRFC